MEMQENKDSLPKISVEDIKKCLKIERKEKILNEQKLKSDIAELLAMPLSVLYAIAFSAMIICAWGEIKSYFSWDVIYFFYNISSYMNYVFNGLLIFFVIKLIICLVKYIKTKGQFSLKSFNISLFMCFFFLMLSSFNSVKIYGISS